MENKFYTDDFERLIKERSDEFRMYPSKRVWHSIYNDLHPGRRWPSIAMSLMLIIALLYMGFLNNDSAGSKQAAINGVSKNNILTAENKGTNDHSSNINGNSSAPVTSNVDNGNDPSSISSSTSTTAANTNPVTVVSNGHVTTKPEGQANPYSLNSSNSGQDIAAHTNHADNNNNNAQPQLNQANNRRTAHRRVVNNSNARTSINIATITASIDNATIAKNPTTSTSTLSNKMEPTVDDNNVIDVATDVASMNGQTKTDITTTSSILNKENDKKASTDVQGVANEKKNVQAETEKAWIENYAFYNKSNRKRWKDRMATEFHVTPSVSYRNLSGNAAYDPAASSFSSGSAADNVSKAVNQTPGIGLEAGFGVVYSAAKRLRLTGGVQLNFTNYNIHADNISHPVITTLLLNNSVTGTHDIVSASSTLSNVSNLQPTIVHSSTYQVSIPLGLAWKLYSKNKIEWYAGASIQPTYVFGGQTFMISSDRKNYIQDANFMRRWNLNTGVETYVSYNVGSFNLQMGPQFRYQLFSTFNKQYTNTEKIYNVGLKIGLLKNF